MYIVTGAAGFIGSVFVSRMNHAGMTDLILVDELGSSERWKNLLGKRFSDYLHKDDLQAFLENTDPDDIEGIVHMGACSSTVERDVDYLYRNNFLYTKMLAEYSMENDIRFIYASSAATYGDGSLGYDDGEEFIPSLRPLNPYGFSKQILDLWALENGYFDRICGIKFFNVYGPNEYHKEGMRSVVLKAYYQVKEFGTVKLFRSHRPEYKDGEQVRDFIYVKDCAEILYTLLTDKRDINGIFNLGTGKARTWNDLVSAVFSSLKLETKIQYIEMPEDILDQYQYFTEAKMDKLKAAGFSARFTSLEDGVSDYVTQYLEKGEGYI